MGTEIELINSLSYSYEDEVCFYIDQEEIQDLLADNVRDEIQTNQGQQEQEEAITDQSHDAQTDSEDETIGTTSTLRRSTRMIHPPSDPLPFGFNKYIGNTPPMRAIHWNNPKKRS